MSSTYNPKNEPSDNLKQLLRDQNADGIDSASFSGSEPFPVLAAKAAFNADTRAADAQNSASIVTGDVKISYTGTPLWTPIAVAGLDPIIFPASFSGVTVETTPLKTLTNFQYYESVYGNVLNTAGFQGLTSITFDTLQALSGALFNLTGLPSCTSISFPELLYSTIGIGPTGCTSLTSISVPKLLIAQLLNATNCASLTTISAPELRVMYGTPSPQNLPLLTTYSFPKLEVWGGCNFASCPLLASLSFPSVKYIIQQVRIQAGMNSLLQISAPNVISCADLTFAGGPTALNNITTLFTVGTLKNFGGDFIANGLNLSAASVNHILAVFASLDGTNGTTLWARAGKTINLSGGTNAAPTGQGIIDKATLVGRGATVTTN